MNYKIKYKTSIENWDEAVPLGNGFTGCLIWGGPTDLRFSLDRTDIWDTSVPFHTQEPEFSYENLVRLVKKKQTKEIQRIFNAPYQFPTPTKLPAGKILLKFEEGTNVRSVLKLQTAEAFLTVETKQEKIKIRAICHAVNKTGMIKVTGPAPAFTVRLENPPFGQEASFGRKPAKNSLESLNYPPFVPGKAICENGSMISWFLQEISKDFSYGVVMGVLKKRNSTLIFYRIVTSSDGEGWLEAAVSLVKEQLVAGYKAHLPAHRDWWQNYWSKSDIRLPEPFYEKRWYLTNYLFASCSRKGGYPMPLQGVWTADNGFLPPWKGDYHNDLNTQLSYTHFYKANHLEEGECFLDFLWGLKNAAADFAKDFYHAEGICLPGVMTIDGLPLGGWPMYSLSPVHQIWLCQSFELYYRYTGDRNFLEKRAWVYFEETAKCIGGLLEIDGKGQYRLPLSSSPEIHDDKPASWLTPNSNYDLALLRYLYETLMDFSFILGNGKQNDWLEILNHLPNLAVNKNRVFMLSPDESLNESHRHLSNAMAICPLRLYRYETPDEKKVIDAVIEDYQRLGTGNWVGFSFTWMAHLYAVQGNGEGALEQLRIFWESFCGPNGFHLNGDFKKRGYSAYHYRPFTLEANMYAADALQEMLFQMTRDVIHLFPSVPDAWKEKGVRFENFRGTNGVTVSASIKKGAITKISLLSPMDQQVNVKGFGTIHLKADEAFHWNKKQ